MVDIKTIPVNQSSVALEEVLPVSQSDSTLLAPEEIQVRGEGGNMLIVKLYFCNTFRQV